MHFSFPLRHANLSKLASLVTLELRRKVALDLCREIDRFWQLFRAPAETGNTKKLLRSPCHYLGHAFGPSSWNTAALFGWRQGAYLAAAAPSYKDVKCRDQMDARNVQNACEALHEAKQVAVGGLVSGRRSSSFSPAPCIVAHREMKEKLNHSVDSSWQSNQHATQLSQTCFLVKILGVTRLKRSPALIRVSNKH